MSNGILMFVHDSDDLSYSAITNTTAKLAIKNLSVPVSVVTDKKTSDKLDKTVFDNIIEIENQGSDNYRSLKMADGIQKINFFNQSRFLAAELTPYDKTLLLDIDFLVLTDRLNEFWNIDQDFLIAPRAKFIADIDNVFLESHLSQKSIPMSWATTIMYNKSQQSKLIFNLVNHIKENYNFYSDAYGFSNTTFRNDKAFSIACHIINNCAVRENYNLPDILTATDQDDIVLIDNKGLLFCSERLKKRSLIKIDTDVHVMNKYALTKNLKELEKLL